MSTLLFATDTSIGVLALIGFILLMTAVLVVFIVAQVGREHTDDVRHERELHGPR
jgi:hypothetical protein